MNIDPWNEAVDWLLNQPLDVGDRIRFDCIAEGLATREEVDQLSMDELVARQEAAESAVVAAPTGMPDDLTSDGHVACGPGEDSQVAAIRLDPSHPGPAFVTPNHPMNPESRLTDEQRAPMEQLPDSGGEER